MDWDKIKGARIRQGRKKAGLTQKQFGDMLGISTSSVSRLEKGNRDLTDEEARLISRELGVTFDDLPPRGFKAQAKTGAEPETNAGGRQRGQSQSMDRAAAHPRTGDGQTSGIKVADKARSWDLKRRRVFALIMCFLTVGGGLLFFPMHARFHAFVMLICCVFIVLLGQRLLELDKQAGAT